MLPIRSSFQLGKRKNTFHTFPICQQRSISNYNKNIVQFCDTNNMLLKIMDISGLTETLDTFLRAGIFMEMTTFQCQTGKKLVRWEAFLMCFPRQMFKKNTFHRHLHLCGILTLCWFMAVLPSGPKEADKTDKCNIWLTCSSLSPHIIVF